jgi:hypothetical protein
MNKSKFESVPNWRVVRSRIRRLPLLGIFAGFIGDCQRFIVKKFQVLLLPKIEIYEEFKEFSPNSAGSPGQRTVLTKNTIHRLFPEINRLVNLIAPKEDYEIQTIEEFLNSRKYNESLADELKALFMERGSDKALPNNYYKLYAYLLSTIDNPRNILEIGLGSNNLKVVSNMGIYGKPGASIRAFRDYLPTASIYGADIDREALFQEERITTAWVDQTEPTSLDALFEAFDVKFDLIIDDGLHSPDANVSTLIASISRCSNGGYVVIEDVAKTSREIWMLIEFLLLSSKIDARILSGTNADVFLVKVL